MSYYDYKQSQLIAVEDYPFYALIMAAIRQADSNNLAKLKEAFPNTYKEFINRYNSPTGKLPDEE